MPYATGTMTSLIPAKDMMSTLQTALTGAGYQLVDSYATPTAGNWFGVVYGNNTHVAYANNAATVAVSTDNAVTWTQRTLPNPATITTYSAGAYGAGLFVLIANGTATYVTSPDGITWTARTLPITPALNRQGLVWTGTQFILYSTGTVVLTSPDGLVWTQRTVPAGNWALGASGNGVHIAMNTSGAAAYLYSNDGVNWINTKTMPATNSWGAVTYGNGLFVVMVNGSTTAYTSPDGSVWTLRTTATAGAWQSVAWNGTQFVAVPGNNTVTYVNTSPNGTAWTQQNNALPVGAVWNTVLWVNNQWVAVGVGATFAATSPDGLTWTSRTLTGLSTSPFADVYKSPAAGNSFGQDWYLILRRAAETSPLLYYQVAEQYDPVTHRMSNYGGLNATVAPTPGTYVNPAAASAPDNANAVGSGASVVLNNASAFTYWYSITADRFVLAVKTATTDQAFYAGLYEDLLPPGVSQFPLGCALFPTDALGLNIGTGNTGYAGGFTREPLQAASSAVNFQAYISNGMFRGWGTANLTSYNYCNYGGNWTPTTTATALYGNTGSLARVVIGSGRPVTITADAFRGLLYGVLTSQVAALTGDTITYGGRTYVRIGGVTQTTAYGFYVDAGL